jgi:hypothetical protein
MLFFLALKLFMMAVHARRARSCTSSQAQKKKASGHIFLIRAYIFTFLLVKSQKKMFSYLQPIQNETLLYYLRKKIKAKLIGKSHNNVNSIRSSCHVNYIHTVCKFTKTLWRIIVLVMPFCNDFWRPQFADGTQNVAEFGPNFRSR